MGISVREIIGEAGRQIDPAVVETLVDLIGDHFGEPIRRTALAHRDMPSTVEAVRAEVATKRVGMGSSAVAEPAASAASARARPTPTHTRINTAP